MPKVHSTCHWLILSSTELCGKSCLGDFCKIHLNRLRKGSHTQPCRCCGVGVTNQHEFCFPCGYRSEWRRATKATKREFMRLAAIELPIQRQVIQRVNPTDGMSTVKELREQAKSYRLRGYSTLRKHGLIRLIAEARAPVFRERLERALKTGRYPALRRDIDNPHKKAQRIRELHQLKDKAAPLRAQKYQQEIEKNPRKQLKILQRHAKRVVRHG